MSFMKFWKAAFLFAATPLYMGGGGGSSSSQQSTDTSTQLTNDVTSTDTRSVASDHAVALGGSGNSVTQTSTTNNARTDTNSGNTTTSFKSGSDNVSTFASNAGNTNTNSGNTTVNNTVTDFGSVQAALDAMKTTASKAIGQSGDTAGLALTALSDQSANTSSLLERVFGYAQTSSANSQGTAMQALGLAGNATSEASLSASNEASTANADKKKFMLAIGVMVVVLLLKK